MLHWPGNRGYGVTMCIDMSLRNDSLWNFWCLGLEQKHCGWAMIPSVTYGFQYPYEESGNTTESISYMGRLLYNGKERYARPDGLGLAKCRTQRQ